MVRGIRPLHTSIIPIANQTPATIGDLRSSYALHSALRLKLLQVDLVEFRREPLGGRDEHLPPASPQIPLRRLSEKGRSRAVEHVLVPPHPPRVLRVRGKRLDHEPHQRMSCATRDERARDVHRVRSVVEKRAVKLRFLPQHAAAVVGEKAVQRLKALGVEVGVGSTVEVEEDVLADVRAVDGVRVLVVERGEPGLAVVTEQAPSSAVRPEPVRVPRVVAQP